MQAQRYLQPLDQGQALEKLAGAVVGRVAFLVDGAPVIRPVNHALVDGLLIIRSHVGTGLVEAVRPGRVPVCYEADELDPVDRAGWTVVLKGTASLILDDDLLARYEPLVATWIDQPKDQVVRIEPHSVTGYTLVP